MLGVLKKNWISVVLYIIPLIVLLVVGLQTTFAVFKLFPNPEYLDQLEFFADDTVEGNSTVTDSRITNDQFSFSYQLKPGVDYPFAGCIFNLTNNDNSTLDLSPYQYMTIKMKSDHPRLITIFLKTFDKQVTEIENSVSYRHNQKIITVNSEEKVFKIALNQLGTPEWWFDGFDLDPRLYPEERFKQVASFEIHEIYTREQWPDTEEQTLSVKDITFYPDNFLFFLTLWIVFLYYIILTFILVVRCRRNKQCVDDQWKIPYKRVEVESYEDEDWKRLEEFISQNFDDSELSLHKINLATGLTEKRISALVKKRYKTGFNSYINNIRVNEAKWLLGETDRQVTDIAFMVGYKNTSHFNRVFKQLTGDTPVEFRKKS